MRRSWSARWRGGDEESDEGGDDVDDHDSDHDAVAVAVAVADHDHDQDHDDVDVVVVVVVDVDGNGNGIVVGDGDNRLRVGGRVGDRVGVRNGLGLGPGSGSGSGSGSAAVIGPAAGSGGDVLVHVVWPDTPIELRQSPGRTSCNTPRLGDVAPSTTWGIADVVVMADAGQGSAGDVRVTARPCELAPRVAIGARAIVDSQTEAPVELAVATAGDPHALSAATTATAGSAETVRLPVVGHAATIAVDGVARIGLGSDLDATWVVDWTTAGGITDAAGQVTLRALPPGAHAIVAWLPPRAGHAARIAKGTATVVAGQLVETTLDLGK